MKIKEITMQNYKRFVEKKRVSFCDSTGQPKDVILIAGTNGSGKSSILQAIIMLIASATGKRHLPKINLPGLDIAYIQSGQMPINLTAKIEITEEEIAASKKYAERLQGMGERENVYISKTNSDVNLVLELDKKQVRSNNRGALQGYAYASRLKKFEPNYRNLFNDVGTILWYDDQRTLFSTNDISHNFKTIDSLREILIGAWYFHINVTTQGHQLGAGQQNSFLKIQELYQTIFPSRRFVSAAPRFGDATKQDFWLSDGKNQYELAGMSAGERAIFPMIIDFALLNINNSIIIIDESELHLHPNLHEKLLQELPKWGNNNQIITTTHSPQVISAVPSGCVYLLKNDEIINENIYTEGRDANSILREVLGYENKNTEIKKLLDKISGFMAAYDTENAQKALDELAEKWGEQALEVQRLQSYIDIL